MDIAGVALNIIDDYRLSDWLSVLLVRFPCDRYPRIDVILTLTCMLSLNQSQICVSRKHFQAFVSGG